MLAVVRIAGEPAIVARVRTGAGWVERVVMAVGVLDEAAEWELAELLAVGV